MTDPFPTEPLERFLRIYWRSEPKISVSVCMSP